ncbi:MAG: sulfite exporter TauE/SafE family protein [Alphaproteobacteria bacterium]
MRSTVYSSCALPFLATAVGLKTAIILVVAPAMMANVAVMWSAGYFRETLHKFSRFYVSTIPGICIGILSLSAIDQKVAAIVLGIIIVIYSGFSAYRPVLHLPERFHLLLQFPAGLLNGFFTGLTGSQVLPLLPYMLSINLEPDRFVQAVNMAVTISAAIMIIVLMASGIMDLPGLGMSVLCIAPAMAGIALGTRVRRFIPATQFRTVVLGVLAVIGFVLIIGR